MKRWIDKAAKLIQDAAGCDIPGQAPPVHFDADPARPWTALELAAGVERLQGLLNGALHHAAEGGGEAQVGALLSAGADPMSTRQLSAGAWDLGRLPIHSASKGGSVACVELLLLAAPATAAARDAAGLSPFQLACFPAPVATGTPGERLQVVERLSAALAAESGSEPLPPLDRAEVSSLQRHEREVRRALAPQKAAEARAARARALAAEVGRRSGAGALRRVLIVPTNCSWDQNWYLFP